MGERTISGIVEETAQALFSTLREEFLKVIYYDTTIVSYFAYKTSVSDPRGNSAVQNVYHLV